MNMSFRSAFIRQSQNKSRVTGIKFLACSHDAASTYSATANPFLLSFTRGKRGNFSLWNLRQFNDRLSMRSGLVLLSGQARRLSGSRQLTRNNHLPYCQENPVATMPSAIEPESNGPCGREGGTRTHVTRLIRPPLNRLSYFPIPGGANPSAPPITALFTACRCDYFAYNMPIEAQGTSGNKKL